MEAILKDDIATWLLKLSIPIPKICLAKKDKLLKMEDLLRQELLLSRRC